MDRRNSGVLFEEIAGLSTVDHGSVPGLTAQEMGPHDLKEGAVVEFALQYARIFAHELLKFVAAGAHRRGIGVQNDACWISYKN